ncbi:MAG: hypothetical protein ACKOCB_11685 [Planctomycetia bacterium]
MSYDRGPQFAPAESGDPDRRIRRIEDWAGRHDQWAAQTAVEVRARAAEVEGRVGHLEERVTRLFAAIGEHRLKWGIVAWVVGTAAAAGIAMLAR